MPFKRIALIMVTATGALGSVAGTFLTAIEMNRWHPELWPPVFLALFFVSAFLLARDFLTEIKTEVSSKLDAIESTSKTVKASGFAIEDLTGLFETMKGFIPSLNLEHVESAVTKALVQNRREELFAKMRVIIIRMSDVLDDQIVEEFRSVTADDPSMQDVVDRIKFAWRQYGLDRLKKDQDVFIEMNAAGLGKVKFGDYVDKTVLEKFGRVMNTTWKVYPPR